MPRTKAAEQFDEILEALPDMDRIAEETRRGSPLNKIDLENVSAMILAAGEKWLVNDLDDFEFLEIEKPFSYSVTLPNDKVAQADGTADLLVRIVSKRTVFKQYYGLTMGIDWKSAKGELDPKWDHRYEDKFQWRMYSYFLDLDIFQFRGINRKSERRSLTLPRPNNLDEIVERQLMTAAAIRDSQEPFPIWAMNMPSACLRYGEMYPCPYTKDCPDGRHPQLIQLPLRQTTIEQILHCPEYARRQHLERESFDVDGEGHNKIDAEIGSAMHRGLAELYRQAWWITTGIDLSPEKRYKEPEQCQDNQSTQINPAPSL